MHILLTNFYFYFFVDHTAQCLGLFVGSTVQPFSLVCPRNPDWVRKEMWFIRRRSIFTQTWKAAIAASSWVYALLRCQLSPLERDYPGQVGNQVSLEGTNRSVPIAHQGFQMMYSNSHNLCKSCLVCILCSERKWLVMDLWLMVPFQSHMSVPLHKYMKLTSSHISQTKLKMPEIEPGRDLLHAKCGFHHCATAPSPNIPRTFPFPLYAIRLYLFASTHELRNITRNHAFLLANCRSGNWQQIGGGQG